MGKSMTRLLLPWGLTGVCAIVILMLIVVVTNLQPSMIVQFGCALGDQQSCNEIAVLNDERIFTLLAIAVTGLAGIGFLIWAIVTTAVIHSTQPVTYQNPFYFVPPHQPPYSPRYTPPFGRPPYASSSPMPPPQASTQPPQQPQ